MTISFLLKIINCSHANLIDVKYTLHYCRRFSDGVGELVEIEPSKSRLEFISAFSSADHYADYAVRITYEINNSFEFADNDCMVFTFYAKHALSGTAVFLRKEYTVKDIMCGRFETGKSTKIFVESCNKTFQECKRNCNQNCDITSFCTIS